MCDNEIITPGEIDPRTKIIIGVWDTLNVRSVSFDVSAWVSDYGVGTLQIIHQRQGDDIPYLVQGVAFDPDTGLAVWTFDEIDSAVVGAGAAALVYLVGDEYIARTPAIPTYTGETIGMSGSVVPDPWESWYTQILEACAAAQEAAETAVHQPIIGDNGNWWTWDADAGAYVDTGEEAQGPQGEQGEQGEQGIPGVSPTAYVTQDEDGATITVIDGSGTTTAKIYDGEVTAAQLAAVQAQALAAYATDTVSGNPAVLNDGADGVPVKSVSVTPGDYALMLDVYLAPADGSAVVTAYLADRWRCIVFPVEGGESYIVTSGITGTMRIGTFENFPTLGDTASVYATDTGTSISIPAGVSDKWAVMQFFIDGDSTATLPAALAGCTITPTPVWTADKVTRVGKNVYDKTGAVFTGRYDQNGAVITGSSFRRTGLIPVKGGESYALSVSVAYTSGVFGWFYDAGLNQISAADGGLIALAANATSVIVTAPANAAYASLSVTQVPTNNVQFERGTAVTTFEAYNASTVTVDTTDGTVTGTLATVYGNNDFVTQSGSVSMEYRADTSLYIAKMLGA